MPNSLTDIYPNIAKEWHPTKNGTLTPEDVAPKSDKKAWFVCSKDRTHEWSARIADRTSKGSGCPYCWRRPSKEKNLKVLFPEIAKDWHPTKNGTLTPDKVAPKSNKFFWWKCDKGHSYEMQPSERVINHRGCSKCSKFGGSAQETRIYCEIKSLFEDVKFRHKISGSEIDIFIPSLNIGIEYDGEYFHRERVDKDKKKNELMKKSDIEIVRIREHPLEKIQETDVISPKRELAKNDLNELCKSIYKLRPASQVIFEKYIQEIEFVNQDDFAVYMSYFPSPFPEKSLSKIYPEVASQWDYEKNYPLTPDNFTHGSKHKVWWICENGHSHQTSINSKTWHRNGKYKGCKYCSEMRLAPSDKIQTDLFSSQEKDS